MRRRDKAVNFLYRKIKEIYVVFTTKNTILIIQKLLALVFVVNGVKRFGISFRLVLSRFSFLLMSNSSCKLDWWRLLPCMGLWDHPMDDQTRILLQPDLASFGMKGASSMKLESQISSSEFLQHRQEHSLWAHLWTLEMEGCVSGSAWQE